MKINPLSVCGTKILNQHFKTVSKALFTVSASACLVLALSSCAKENTSDEMQVIDETTQSSLPAQTIRIAAAANLSDVLPDIIEGYKVAKNLPDQEIEITFASSGKLYAQIQAGAPYDIFLSANQEFPKKLAEAQAAGKSLSDNSLNQTFTYTQGQLALYSVTKPINDLNPTSLAALLVAETDSKVTIANPELAPYGESAKVYLQTQNIYDLLNSQKRLIQAENIGQAFQYAHTGSVDYGLVAQSQVTAIKATSAQFYTLPPDSYPPILQDGIDISNSNNNSNTAVAADFLGYLLSPAGQKYFMQAGYLAVK